MTGFQKEVRSTLRTPAEVAAGHVAEIAAVREVVARAICEACDESPDQVGDAGGNAYRWQDYLKAADAAMAVLGRG